jgi:hypothetical protein
MKAANGRAETKAMFGDPADSDGTPNGASGSDEALGASFGRMRER